MLSSVGYQTGAFGKWYLGMTTVAIRPIRALTSGLASLTQAMNLWPSGDRSRAGAHPSAKPSYVMRAKKGSLAKNKSLVPYIWAVIDRE